MNRSNKTIWSGIRSIRGRVKHPIRMVVIGLILVVIAFLLNHLVFWSPEQLDHITAQGARSPMVIAHSGSSHDAPENTLAAIRQALDAGADAVEFDVTLSKDGEVVVIHDATVDRTTNGTGKVNDLTLDELKSLDAGSWFAPQFTGERIPTLQEVIDLVGNRAFMFVELKTEAILPTALESTVVDIVTENRMEKNTVIISFDPFALFYASRRNSEIPTGLLYSDETGNHLRDRWFAPLTHPDGLLPRLQMASDSHLREIGDRGHLVVVWTVNSPGEMERLIEMGVDGIITDRPDVLRDILSRKQNQ